PRSTRYPYPTLFRSVLGGDDPAEFLLVLDEELAEVEHDLGALGEGGLRPGLECLRGGGDGGVHVGGPAEHDTGLLLAGGRVEHRSEEHTSELQSRFD